MKAIHNYPNSIITCGIVVVYPKDTEKWKQFTTDTDGTYTQFKLTDERAEQSFIDEHVARDKAEFIEWTAKKNLAKVPKSKYDDVINDLRDVTRYLSSTEKKALIVKILLDIL